MSSTWLLNSDLGGGGAERQLLQLADVWAGQNAALSVVLLTGGGAFRGDVPAQVPVVSLSSQRPSPMLGQLLWGLRLVGPLAALAHRHRPAAVLSFLTAPTLVAGLALRAKVRQPKLIWSVQSDLIEEYNRSPLKRFALHLLRRLVMPKVDLFIACSHGIREQLEQSFQVPADRIRVVPNAIDFSRLTRLADTPGPDLPPKRARYRVISIGRCAVQKDYDTLLAAFAQMTNQDVELYVLGDGPLRSRLERTAGDLGLTGRVHFAGFVSNPYAWLRTADLFVSPSRWEPFGIVIAEAMACGLPVVATATHGARDLLDPAETGVLVPLDRRDALAAAIDTLLENETLRRQMGEKASEAAKALDAPMVAQRYAEAIAALHRSQPIPPGGHGRGHLGSPVIRVPGR